MKTLSKQPSTATVLFCGARGQELGTERAAHGASSTGLRDAFDAEEDCAIWRTGPRQTSLMFDVIEANGERVMLTADAESSKRYMAHALSRLSFVGDRKRYQYFCPLKSLGLGSDAAFEYLVTCAEAYLEEEVYSGRTAPGPLKEERKSSCTTICRR
ncbi:unnamed protein product [Hyaloperonospora brassicae]|uniref:Uncharacterized protein n=1 Tax=Hyaloperonospora brassicae TaxID=162125 RepID=A0AAV0TD47_HYABA|nr:unnamed protein product [Hyaloperonospora brassicae]